MNRLPPSEKQEPEPTKFALAGLLLVAAPQVEDELFGRTVCLVLEHKPEQSIAVVLNRPFALDVRPLWEQLTQGLTKTAEPPHHLNFGGPLSGPVVAIHDRESLAEGGNGNGIYLAAQVETLKKLALVPPTHYRLLVGHAAWKSGQLEQEIIEGIWYPIPASPDLVFVDDYDMWQESMRKVGGLVMQSVLGMKGLPPSPHLN
jgi:putative transcriptional regulator